MELKGTKNMLHDKGEGVIFSVEGLDEVSDAGEEVDTNVWGKYN